MSELETDVMEGQEVIENPDIVDSSSTEGQEPTDQRTEAEKALIEELQGMRGEFGEMRDANYRMQQEIEFLRNQQIPHQEDDFGEPDDFLERGQAEQLIDKRLQPAMQRLREQELNILEARAKQKYPDFEDVVTNHGKKILQANPNLITALEALDDPAETLYLLAKSSPQYLNDNNIKVKQETVNKIDKNLRSTPTIAGQGGSAVTTQKDWSKATDAEIAQKLRDMGLPD